MLIRHTLLRDSEERETTLGGNKEGEATNNRSSTLGSKKGGV